MKWKVEEKVAQLGTTKIQLFLVLNKTQKREISFLIHPWHSV